MRVQFDALPPDERKAFAVYVRDYLRSKSFGIHHLVKSKEDDGIECPHCRNMEPQGIVKFGVRKGIQWYRCKACGRTFSGVTGTLWSYTKKAFHVWNTFITSMMEGHSVRKSADVCKIHRNTAFIWRHKILDALAHHQNSQGRMTGIVEADDTFFPLSYKGSEPIGRKARKRGEPASKRGISKEKVCVSCAVSRNGQVYSKVSALGKPTANALKTVFRGRLSKKAILCTDNDRAYVKYGNDSPLKCIQLPNGIKKLGTYHVQNINGYHSRLKQFIRRFKGVSTKYLNNYLVWCNVIQESAKSRIELLKLAVKAVVFDTWADIIDRPAVPVGGE
jgi:transposase-like protein